MFAQPGTLEAWHPADGMHSPDMGAGHVSSAGPSQAILHWTLATVGFGFGVVGIMVAAGQPESPSKIQTWQRRVEDSIQPYRTIGRHHGGGGGAVVAEETVPKKVSTPIPTPDMSSATKKISSNGTGGGAG